MKNIDDMLCIEKLHSSGAVYRLNGIVECLDRRSANEEEAAALIALKNDPFILAGRTIGEYATAVLDVLAIETYSGNNRHVLDCISAWKN